MVGANGVAADSLTDQILAANCVCFRLRGFHKSPNLITGLVISVDKLSISKAYAYVKKSNI